MPILSLLNFLGPKGVIAVIFALIMTAEGGLIYIYKNKLQQKQLDYEEQKVLVGKYEVVLNDLKKQLEEADTKNKNLQAALDVTETRNREIRKENGKLKDELSKKPIPKDCTGAIVELKSQSAIIAKKWNDTK